MQHSSNEAHPAAAKIPWNKGKVTGPKPPLQTKHVWSIRTRLQLDGKQRDLAMFNLAIDSNYEAATLSTSRSKMLLLAG